jgi:hypothetical protein
MAPQIGYIHVKIIYSLLVVSRLTCNLLLKPFKVLNFKISSTSPVYAQDARMEYSQYIVHYKNRKKGKHLNILEEHHIYKISKNRLHINGAHIDVHYI